MIASRAKRSRAGSLPVAVPGAIPGVALVIAALVSTLTLGSGQSLGQSAPQGGAETAIGKPIQLAPPSLFAPADQSLTGDGSQRATGRSGTDKTGIEVNKLGEIAPEAIGVLEASDGGLGSALWRGSSRTAIERLLQRLPSSYGSPSLRDLARRVLLSNAATPSAADDTSGEPAASPSGNLAALRVERLAALGDAEGVAALTRVVPQRLVDQSIARARSDSLFLIGETDAACREARNGAAAYPGQTYWSMALVFCQIVEGKADRAALGLALLREQLGDEEPAFFALVEAISGVDVDLPVGVVSTPLFAEMLRFSGKKAPGGFLEEVPSGLLPAIASMSNLGLAERAEAAELGVGSGALDPEALRQIYAAFSFSPEDFEKVLEVAPALEGPVGRALLYQAARAESLPVALAEILNVALEASRGSGHYTAQVRTYEPLLATVPPQPEMIWFAETAGRAFFMTGAYERASAWVDVVRGQVAVEPTAGEILARLSPFALLTGFKVAGAGEGLSAWHEATSGEAANGVAELLFLRASLQALGVVDPLSWTDLMGQDGLDAGAPLQDVPLLYAAQSAAAAGRRGEAILAVLAAVGETPPDEMHPVALGAVLGALRTMGLGDEARAMAIEIAVARGI